MIYNAYFDDSKYLPKLGSLVYQNFKMPTLFLKRPTVIIKNTQHKNYKYIL